MDEKHMAELTTFVNQAKAEADNTREGFTCKHTLLCNIWIARMLITGIIAGCSIIAKAIENNHKQA